MIVARLARCCVVAAVALTSGACAGSPAAPSGTPTSPSAAAGVVSAVFDLTNAERARVGLAVLRTNTQLNQAAQVQSDQMVRAGVMEHVIPSAPLPNTADRLAAAGYAWQAYAENIAAGHPGAAAVVLAWMQSASHRASILNATYTELGVGYALDARGRPYYTQVFGRPMP